MTAVIAPVGPAAETGFPLTVQMRRLDTGIEAPSYAQPGDAGADLRTTEDVILKPGERKLVPTGIAIALPLGFVGLIHPRSGLAAKHGLTVVNTPGTIDAGYRGEIKVCLLNTDRENQIVLARGDRIAQLVIQRVETAVFEVVDELPESDRGEGGFGSTGGFMQSKAAVAPFGDLPVLEKADRLVASLRAVAPETGDRSLEVLRSAFILALGTPDSGTVDLAGLVRTAKLWLEDSYRLKDVRAQAFESDPEAVFAYQRLQVPGSAALSVPRNRLQQLVSDPALFAAWSEQVLSA